MEETIVDKKEDIRNKIHFYKLQLESTDYKALKYAEGVISESEYAVIKTQRQEWRNEINKLEEQLNI